METRDALERVDGVHQQVVFIAGNVHHADSLEIIDGGTETDGVGDAAGAGFEASGRGLVRCFFKGDVLNHVAAAVRRLGVL
jgi:hypothetical protein